MQSSLSVNNVQPNFQAKVSKHFIKDAHNVLGRQMNNQRMLVNFDEKVAEFEQFGYDDFFIKYIKEIIDGKVFHKLIAVKKEMKDSEGIILTSKDRFRKAIEKFTHINKFEFTQKMKKVLENS